MVLWRLWLHACRVQVLAVCIVLVQPSLRVLLYAQTSSDLSLRCEGYPFAPRYDVYSLAALVATLTDDPCWPLCWSFFEGNKGTAAPGMYISRAVHKLRTVLRSRSINIGCMFLYVHSWTCLLFLWNRCQAYYHKDWMYFSASCTTVTVPESWQIVAVTA